MGAPDHDQLFGSVARFTPWLKNKKVPAPFVRYAPPVGDGAPIHRQRTVPTQAPVLIREVEWEHGFVARASLDLREKRAAELVDLLTQFLRLPICRFLRTLGLGAEANGGERYCSVSE